MNFENIKCFLTLAETLNFTKAATLEHITQTSMSRKINALEMEMGVILFFRDNKKVSLTPAGEEFYHQAVFIYNQYRRLLKTVQDIHIGLRKEIHIGVGLYEHILFEKYLNQFIQKFPEIKVNCLQFQYLPLIKQLEHGYLDIIFTSDQFFNQVDLTKYDVILIYNQPWKVAVKSKGKLSDISQLKPSHFSDQTLITMLEGSVNEIKEFYHKWLEIKDSIYANSYDTKICMIKAGLGLGFMPSFVPEQLENEILLKDMEYPIVFRKFYVMTKKNIQNIYIKQWMDMIRNH